MTHGARALMSAAVCVAGLTISACAAGVGERAEIVTRGSASGFADIQGVCPATAPQQPAFIPSEPFPPEPPLGQVWYGTPILWTILDPGPQVWTDLPVRKDGSVFNKTLWWSEGFSTTRHEDFTGDADITVTAKRLDGPARAIVVEGGVPSSNPDIGNFLLVGLRIPEPGCWEVAARYHGADLAYVVQVEPPT